MSEQADVVPDNTAKDELEARRKAEIEQRQQNAMARANAMSTLMLGERLDLGDQTVIMAVPGGWIFSTTHKAGITSTFVPQPVQKPNLVKTEPAIVMPNA